MDGIEFEFEGIRYEAPGASSEDTKFVLPDGRLIEATSWTEGESHIPLTFVEILYAAVYSDLKELANKFGAFLVEMVDRD